MLGFALAAGWPPSAAGATELVDLKLVLAVDVSGSIDPVEARLQREGYVRALTHPEVIAAIQTGFRGRIAVTYVEWAGAQYQTTVVGWRLIHDEASARAFASAIAAAPRLSERFTSISSAIDYAVPLFAGKDFESLRRVIDISGDGPNNAGGPVVEARDRAVRAGITINGLPIVNERPSRWGGRPMPHLDLYYRNCVIGGPMAFIVVAKDFGSFAQAIRRKLILEIAGKVPEEDAAPSARLALRGARGPAPRAAVLPLSGPSLLRAVRRAAAPSPSWTAAPGPEAPPCDIGERFRRRFFEDPY